jgi:hypothetical protein
MQLATTAKFTVSMKSTYNPTTKLLTVNVTGKALSALTGSWRISALLVEDSIASDVNANYNQHSYLSSGPATACNGQPSWWLGLGSPITPASKYAHMQVVTAMLSTTVWGDAAFTNPAAGDSYTKTYTYTVPSTAVASRMRVIGFVAKYGSASTDRAIENTISAKLSLMPANTLDVTPVTAVADVEVFPNPARNSITVKGLLSDPSSTKIVVYNAIGQVVANKEYKDSGSLFEETISLNDLSNGVYFMDILSGGEKVSKQFTVAK